MQQFNSLIEAHKQNGEAITQYDVDMLQKTIKDIDKMVEQLEILKANSFMM